MSLKKVVDTLRQKVICLWREFVRWLNSAAAKPRARSARLRLITPVKYGGYNSNQLLDDIVEILLHLRSDSMPATIIVGGNGAKALFTEYTGPNGTGSVIAPLGPIQFASSNGAVATVDAQGNVTAVAAGTCSISGADTVNGLSASDTLTVQPAVVVPPTAQSATLVLTAN